MPIPQDVRFDGTPLNSLITTIASSFASAIQGSIVAYAGMGLPANYLNCDGSEVGRAEYPTLFSVIGTIWGSGDGETTFNVPNLNGRFLRSASTTINVGTYQADQNKSHTHTTTVSDSGEHTHTITLSGAGGHSHTITGNGVFSSGGFQPGGGSTDRETSSIDDHTHEASMDAQGTHSHTVSLSSSGGDECRPLTAVVRYIIFAPALPPYVEGQPFNVSQTRSGAALEVIETTIADTTVPFTFSIFSFTYVLDITSGSFTFTRPTSVRFEIGWWLQQNQSIPENVYTQDPLMRYDSRIEIRAYSGASGSNATSAGTLLYEDSILGFKPVGTVKTGTFVSDEIVYSTGQHVVPYVRVGIDEYDMAGTRVAMTSFIIHCTNV